MKGEDNYVLDESIKFILKNYMSFGRDVARDYVEGNFFSINFDIKKDFRDHGKVYITEEMEKEVAIFKHPTLVLIFHILRKLSKNDNRVYLTASIFTRSTGLSSTSFYRALKELEDSKWIFETSPKHYNVNLNKIFKGSIDKFLKTIQVQEKRKVLDLERRSKLINEEKEQIKKLLDDNKAIPTV